MLQRTTAMLQRTTAMLQRTTAMLQRTTGLLRRSVVLALVAGALAAGCGSRNARPYDNNDLQLLTSYAAKEICSCAFVMEQSDEFCGRWTRASPNLKTWRIDRDKKIVETQAVLFWGARARFVSRRQGCVAE